MSAYYNENDPAKAAWLRELIRRELIAPGDVDERSILDVFPGDLASYTQCHFFAGVGVWSYALRLAGWPDDRPVWTGSCPCQPFSAAGKRGGTSDERHLWPYWLHLIRCGRPESVLGEQVSSPAGLGWWDLVSADLEAEIYTPWAVDFSSAGVGAPIIRQRLYWMASANKGRWGRRASVPSGSISAGEAARRVKVPSDTGGSGAILGMDLSPEARCAGRGISGAPESARDEAWMPQSSGRDSSGRLECPAGDGRRQIGEDGEWRDEGSGAQGRAAGPAVRSSVSGLGRASGTGLAEWTGEPGDDGAQFQTTERAGGTTHWSDATAGFWRDPDWLFCRDGRWRPVRPGSQPLAHGAPARVVRLRGFGDAINAQAAAAFISTVMEVL